MRWIPVFGLYWLFKNMKSFDSYSNFQFAAMALSRAVYHTFFLMIILVEVSSLFHGK